MSGQNKVIIITGASDGIGAEIAGNWQSLAVVRLRWYWLHVMKKH
jgi:NAD(P)-dependent dehydrogenase (short-subunit alcohol dehydrogenase family)